MTTYCAATGHRWMFPCETCGIRSCHCAFVSPLSAEAARLYLLFPLGDSSPRRKRFPPKRQIAPDAESARPDTVWKSRAFLTLAADRQCQKKEQSSGDSHNIALPTPTHTSVLLLCACRRMLVLVDKLSGLLWFQVSGYFAKRAYRLQRRSPPWWST